MAAGKSERAIHRTSQFKSDLKTAMSHKKCNMVTLTKAMSDIVARKPLDATLLDHPLRGRYPDRRDGSTDCRECHTSNDWLLVYRYPDEDSVVFIRTGTHSELF